MRRLLLCGLVAALVAAPGLAQATATAQPRADGSSAAADSDSPDGSYQAVAPARILDTRAAGGKVAPGASRTVQVTGAGGVPATGVSTAVVNLTATGGTKAGYLSASAGGTTAGSTSSLNFRAGETRANLVTVRVGSDGSIVVRNGDGPGTAPVNVIVDVQGYYLNASAAQVGSHFFREIPARFYDTRVNGTRRPLGPSSVLTIRFPISLGDGATVSALAANVTAVGSTKGGYLVAYNGVGDPPKTSNVNFGPRQTTPNNVVLPVSTTTVDGKTTGTIAIANGSVGTTHVVIDVVGSYGTGSGGLVFHPLDSPQRIVDSRSSVGTSRLGPDQTVAISPPDSVLDPLNTIYLVGNLTAVKPTAQTYLTLWPAYSGMEQRPGISALNPAAGQTVANHAFVELNSSNEFHLYNNAGSTEVLLDVTGRFDYFPSGDAWRGARPRSAVREVGQAPTEGSVRPLTH